MGHSLGFKSKIFFFWPTLDQKDVSLVIHFAFTQRSVHQTSECCLLLGLGRRSAQCFTDDQLLQDLVLRKATIELTLNQPKTQLGIMYRLCVLSLICMSLQDTINTTVWIMAAREEVWIWPEWLQPLLAFVGFFGLLWSPYFPSELQNEVNMHMCSSSRRPVGMFPQLC